MYIVYRQNVDGSRTEISQEFDPDKAERVAKALNSIRGAQGTYFVEEVGHEASYEGMKQ